MACPTCGISVLFGGFKDGDKKYCSKRCYEADEINRIAMQIPHDAVVSQTNKIRNGKCPVCQGDGPIDVHKSYFVYSIIIYTSYKTNEHIVCKECARKKQFSDLFLSSLLGWWGIPFGLIITPIQIVKNVVILIKSPDQSEPTELMTQRIRQMLATKQLETST
jgi:endogenous inhibitor of DNA gyrase (YacG/DUF329 family)